MLPLLKQILWRLATGIAVLWGAATLTFIAINAAEGDTALSILGEEAMPTRAVLERVRSDYGLDRPLSEQYFMYVGRLARGDLGQSYRLRIPVVKAIGQQLGATAALTLAASVTALVFAITAAVLTARRGRGLRSFTSGAEVAVSSVPPFLLGILLLLIFSFGVPLFPWSGSQGWQSLVLPTLTLALPIGAVLAQVLRQELEEILEQPFIVTARTRGMSDVGVRLWHALRHALIPLTTMTGFIVAGLLGGAVIVESLFARQGVGQLMIEAANNRDVPVVLGVTLLAAFVYVVVNLVVDLLYTLIDPRARVT
jgi:peptide/nickel transport system permease protein